ncbi:hypothetical protein H4R99_005185 [Coemansia sp. RSA 1722]|nr:hypothetical protein IWW45_005835 [Coemansia sp. RSA 485]KAJ2595819.1 hypothetical protein H4R99_005185 [Coemansia sp. RSA 1722]
MSKQPEDSWEHDLFHPPPWPFASDDPDAPTKYPGNQNYGYNIRDLDTLPIKTDYYIGRVTDQRQKHLQESSNTMSETEAKNYYLQFQVFREIMTDPTWAEKQYLHGQRNPDNSDREPSTESTQTAVSQSNSDPNVDSESEDATSTQSKDKPKEESWGKSFTLMRIPLISWAIGAILVELVIYFVVRQLVSAYERYVMWRGERGRAFKHLKHATTYAEYMAAAREMDNCSVKNGRRGWHGYLDRALLKRLTLQMRETRNQVEKQGTRRATLSLCDVLSGGALRANTGGWENRQVWARGYSGPPNSVAAYIDEATACLQRVRLSVFLSASEKQEFFRRIARQQGRTALCLSGGAAMGWKHLGVARSLLMDARLPRVISGASAGSVVAALLATHTDDELRRIIRPELGRYMTACQSSLAARIHRWLREGHCFDAVEWAPRAQIFTRGNLTFKEAFERTGKVLNIPCTPLGHRYASPRLLNYVTAPNVVIWSAVLASACLPGILQPMVLLRKARDGKIVPYTDSGMLWRDGSFRNDIPGSDLRAMFNVRSTIVSQVNPHISLFFYNRDGSVGQPTISIYGSRLWRGGFVLSALEHALKLDIRKHLRLLSDLNLVPLLFNQDWSFVWLQKFDGNQTILPKSNICELLYLLSDPTEKSLARSIYLGQAATWPKVSAIRMRQQLEDAVALGWTESHSAETFSSSLHRTDIANAAADERADCEQPDQKPKERKDSGIDMDSPVAIKRSTTINSLDRDLECRPTESVLEHAIKQWAAIEHVWTG